MNNTTSFNQAPIILGIDPGTIVTGYAIIMKKNDHFIPIDYGCIKPPKNSLLSFRYHAIFKGISHLLKIHSPTQMAIETPFVSKNPQSAIKLGSAFGTAIIAAKEHGLKIYAYSPREVKQGITGSGSASKNHVALCLHRLAPSFDPNIKHDASDALSIALYHAFASENPILYPCKEL